MMSYLLNNLNLPSDLICSQHIRHTGGLLRGPKATGDESLPWTTNAGSSAVQWPSRCWDRRGDGDRHAEGVH